MSLSKASLCQAEGLNTSNLCWSMHYQWYSCRFSTFACSCAIVVLCTALLAVGVGLLLSCLLLQAWLRLVLHLLVLLLASACPSSPEMICWFLFSRLGLELHLAFMMFCWMCLGDGLQELVLFLVYGAGTVMFLRWCCVRSVCVQPPWYPSPGW
jgi:hypothetical protein